MNCSRCERPRSPITGVNGLPMGEVCLGCLAKGPAELGPPDAVEIVPTAAQEPEPVFREPPTEPKRHRGSL